MKKGSGKKPECHPNRKHYAKGLCASCYHAQAKKQKSKHKHKEPVRVIHTHEIIRQVQPEEKQTMAAAHDEPKAAKEEAPKAVTSPAGTTEPTRELGGDGITPKAEWDKKYAELKKKQDEHDERRRQQARDDAGPMLTTEKQSRG